MKFKGTIIGEASGSVASLTFSHNRGGQYIRQRAVPVNPGTVEQQEVRTLLASLTSAWLNVLTAAQRAAWDTYALNVPFPDSLGEPRNIGGLAAYVGANVPRQQAAMARVDDAPVVFNRGDFTSPVIVSVTSPTALSLSFTNTDEWANEVGAAMLVSGSRGVNPSINFFKGPYRFAAAILGAAMPPTSPAAIVLPFPIAVGQRVFVQARVVRADGRWSATFRDFGLAV